MSALVKKEIRLLLPAWVTAMLLVFAPIPAAQLFREIASKQFISNLTLFGVVVAGVILGLAGFGRELSARTFTLLLAQPSERMRFWRAKIGVLLVGLTPLGLFLVLFSRQLVVSAPRGEAALMWFVTIAVTVTGGLWTTLLFRQIIASFWISVLVPFAIVMFVLNLEEDSLSDHSRSVLLTTLLLGYSAAGYWFARWQFRRAQDTAWTGGNVSFEGIAGWLPWRRAVAARAKTHPLRALFVKELQLQQINFLLAGLFLVLQIAVQLTPRMLNPQEHSLLMLLVEGFWCIWIVMPLVVGSSAFAEERKFGTLGTQFCLPLARTHQFLVKGIVTIICGTLLGAIVPVALSFIAPTPGASGTEFILSWTIACACLSVVAFYASSLTSQMLQGFGAAVGIIVVGLLLGNWFAGTFSRSNMEFTLFGFNLWRGPLVLATGPAVMLVTAMVLSWRRLKWVWICVLGLLALLITRNEFRLWYAVGLQLHSEIFGFEFIKFLILILALCPVVLTLVLAARNAGHLQTSLRLWSRNVALWLGCLLATGVVNALVYHRAWEMFMRFEPPAGTARLAGNIPPSIHGLWGDRPMFNLLPDGTLCTFKAFQQVRLPEGMTANQESNIWQRVEHPSVRFLSESNWMVVDRTGREAVGVKADGSLWSANLFEQVDQAGKAAPFPTGVTHQKGYSIRGVEPKFTRTGDTADWQSVASSWNHCVALKRDGTMWGWGQNGNCQLGEGPGTVTNSPIRIGTNSDWVAVFATPGRTFSVNQSGEVWRWGEFKATVVQGSRITELDLGRGPMKLDFRVSGVRNIQSESLFDLILDTDGNLWGLGRIRVCMQESPDDGFQTKPQRLRGSNWSAISMNWTGFAGLKQDGTLWSVAWGYGKAVQPLERLGRRKDWIAISKEWNAVLALARDGTICCFGDALESGDELLASTRLVTWSLNLLENAK